MSAGCGSFRHVCPVPSSEPAQIRGNHRPSSNLRVSLTVGGRRTLTGSLARSAGILLSGSADVTWSQTFYALGIVVVVGAIGGWFVARALGF